MKWTFLGLILMGALAGAVPAPAEENAAAVLAPLETAVSAAPDDLRPVNEYRRAVIRLGEYDRALGFFEKLVAAHPNSANAWLNYGYAYVDKIPAAGAITQVILANEAVTRFSKSIEIAPSWLALYTRGNSYLFWPKIFGRAPLGVADLEEAVAMARREPKKKKVYVRSWIALGEGYWKTDQLDKARAIWREGLDLFPGNPRLQALLARNGDELEAYIDEHLDPHKRVDTDLTPLWEEE